MTLSLTIDIHILYPICRRYHNPHCALCNGQPPVNASHCAPPSAHTRGRVSVFTRLLIPSLSFLLEFSEAGDCGLGRFYDPVYRRCYSRRCGLRKGEYEGGINLL